MKENKSIEELSSEYLRVAGEIKKLEVIRKSLVKEIKEVAPELFSVVEKNTFNTKLFKADYPDLYNKYIIRGTYERIKLKG